MPVRQRQGKGQHCCGFLTCIAAGVDRRENECSPRPQLSLLQLHRSLIEVEGGVQSGKQRSTWYTACAAIPHPPRTIHVSKWKVGEDKGKEELGASCAKQRPLQLLGVAADGQTERAGVLLDAAGGGWGDADAGAVVPLLAVVAADHGRIGVVWLLAHAVQVMLVVLAVLATSLPIGVAIVPARPLRLLLQGDGGMVRVLEYLWACLAKGCCFIFRSCLACRSHSLLS